MIIVNVLLLIIGFVLLIFGANLFVDGSSNLAKNLKISTLIIGLTIVAFGTSAPEFAVSVSAILKNSYEISLSNVVGSNLFNLLIVLGVSAIINNISVDDNIIKRDLPLSIASIILVLFLSSFRFIVNLNFLNHHLGNEQVGVITLFGGIVLLLIFFIYIVVLLLDAKKNRTKDEQTQNVFGIKKCILFILIGLVLIIYGGQVVVDNAKKIAYFFHLSETFIGLTIVAVGTSLPELTTSIVAARKKEAEIAVGNVIGSNIFNMFVIVGVSSVLNPVIVNFSSFLDLIILFVSSLLLYLFCLNDKKLKKINGLIFIIIYLFVVLFALFRK